MAKFNLACFYSASFFPAYGSDRMSSTLFDLQSKQTLDLTVWGEIVIYRN